MARAPALSRGRGRTAAQRGFAPSRVVSCGKEPAAPSAARF